ncbi:MAG: trypsin-like peptidase domain-containing protein [Planctomycetia bacterium]|nr:trypsin-like peptidase domain-containing protein [Planctomycetia bacterium]
MKFWQIVIIVALWLLAIGLLAEVARADVHTASRASVRIWTQNARREVGIGSGIVVGESDDAFFVLSNAHVVSSKSVSVEFFEGGHIALRLSGVCVARDSANDVAIVKLQKSEVVGYDPAVMPLDPAYVFKEGETLATIGHPHGGSPTGYFCKYLGTSSLGIHFKPPPAQGRSGSALFDKDLTRVVGLVYAAGGDMQAPTGYAVPVQSFSKALGTSFAQTNEQKGEEVEMSTEDVYYLTCYDLSDGATPAEIVEEIATVSETRPPRRPILPRRPVRSGDREGREGEEKPRRPILPRRPVRSGDAVGEIVPPEAIPFRLPENAKETRILAATPELRLCLFTEEGAEGAEVEPVQCPGGVCPPAQYAPAQQEDLAPESEIPFSLYTPDNELLPELPPAPEPPKIIPLPKLEPEPALDIEPEPEIEPDFGPEIDWIPEPEPEVQVQESVPDMKLAQVRTSLGTLRREVTANTRAIATLAARLDALVAALEIEEPVEAEAMEMEVAEVPAVETRRTRRFKPVERIKERIADGVEAEVKERAAPVLDWVMSAGVGIVSAFAILFAACRLKKFSRKEEEEK